MLKQIEELSISITLSVDTIESARRQIHGCELCSNHVTVSVGELLRRLTGFPMTTNDYFISEDIHCPRCRSCLDPKSLVETQHGAGRAAMKKLLS
jgi:hypothetical protein